MPPLDELKRCIVQRTCVHCKFGLAGVGTGQVLRRAGVDARMVGAGVEDDQRVLGVVVHKGVVAAL